MGGLAPVAAGRSAAALAIGAIDLNQLAIAHWVVWNAPAAEKSCDAPDWEGTCLVENHSRNSGVRPASDGQVHEVITEHAGFARRKSDP